MRSKDLRGWLIVLTAFALVAASIPATAATQSEPTTAIVWVADISGSMPEIDPQRYWSDAVSLGADLAPLNTEAAFIAFNDAVTTQMPLLDMFNADNRDKIKQAARDATLSGNTDFVVGLNAALDLLETTAAKDKHIFFVADFFEAGFVLKDDKNYSNVPDNMAALAERITDSKVKVHMLFLRSPTYKQRSKEFAPLWDDLAEKTSSEIIRIDDPATLPRIVEECYLEEFSYNYSVTTGINTSKIVQDIPVQMPEFNLDRARVFISSDTPLQGMQARIDGKELSFSKTNTYFMAYFLPSLRKTVTVSIPPNDGADVRVYLLVDGSMTLTAKVDSEAELNEAADAYRQKTTVTLMPDRNGAPLFNGATSAETQWSLTAAAPDGQKSDVDVRYENGTIMYSLYPESFGLYTYSLSVESHGIKLTAKATAKISKIEVPKPTPTPTTETKIIDPPIDPPIDPFLLIAIALGATLILTAVLLALSHRKREKPEKGPIRATLASPTAPTAAPAGMFTGKLDIYGILVEGGGAEIPATSFQLGNLGKSRSTNLAVVLEQAGVPYRYPDASHIQLSPAPDYTLRVVNHSGAVIYCGGQPRFMGQQATLAYGQKMRVVFEDEVSEYEIYYHNSVQMAGNHIHMELEDQYYS